VRQVGYFREFLTRSVNKI